MPAITIPPTPSPTTTTTAFPSVELERRLREQLTKAAEDSEVIHDQWEPVLDSLVVVGVILEIEDLFPSISLPPEKLIRQGGYRSIEEGVTDISNNLRDIWNKHYQARTGS